uniref:Uncharacterized protein n=1 Tax=Zea mays TaxID=4577 RepID=B6SS83_MAIZE|nr:hypothetical protein [Zea mays]|eukprot:NP_001142943.1 uncharacterized protein LOC100275386 [Zea mays]
MRRSDLCSPNPRRRNTLALRRCHASLIAPRRRAITVVDMHARSELISSGMLIDHVLWKTSGIDLQVMLMDEAKMDESTKCQDGRCSPSGRQLTTLT